MNIDGPRPRYSAEMMADVIEAYKDMVEVRRKAAFWDISQNHPLDMGGVLRDAQGLQQVLNDLLTTIPGHDQLKGAKDMADALVQKVEELADDYYASYEP